MLGAINLTTTRRYTLSTENVDNPVGTVDNCRNSVLEINALSDCIVNGQ